MKIVLSGGWSYGNIGDEAIARCTISLIHEYFPNVELIISSYDSDDFFFHHQLESVPSVHKILCDAKITDLALLPKIIESPREFFLQGYADLLDNDTIFIMGGGGYLVGDWDSMFLARLVEIRLAKKNGAKVFLVGQSIGPIPGERRMIAKEALELCDGIYVRDIASKQFVNSVMGKEVAKLGADVAITIAEMIPQKKYEDDLKHISVMLQTFAYHVNEEYSKKKNHIWEKIKKRVFLTKYIYNWKLIRILKTLSSQKDVHLDFVLSVQKTKSISNQHFIEYVKYLVKKIPKGKYTIHTDLRLEDFCGYLSAGIVTFSVKMHPLVVSSSYMVDTVALTQNYKIDGFMASIERGRFCHKNTEINTKCIIKQITESIKKDSRVDNQNVINLRNRVREMFEEIKRNIGE